MWGWNPFKDIGQAWHDTLGQHWRGTVQAVGVVAGAAALVTGVGAALDVGVLGLTASQAATVSVVAGYVSGAADIPSCASGSTAACLGVGFNLLGSGLGTLGLYAGRLGSEAGSLLAQYFPISNDQLVVALGPGNC